MRRLNEISLAPGHTRRHPPWNRRDILIDGRPDVRLVYLKGEESLIARRMATRHGHFMPAGLLHSQFETLEEPAPDERPISVSITPKPREIVVQIMAQLKAENKVKASGA